MGGSPPPSDGPSGDAARVAFNSGVLAYWVGCRSSFLRLPEPSFSRRTARNRRAIGLVLLEVTLRVALEIAVAHQDPTLVASVPQRTSRASTRRPPPPSSVSASSPAKAPPPLAMSRPTCRPRSSAGNGLGFTSSTVRISSWAQKRLPFGAFFVFSRRNFSGSPRHRRQQTHEVISVTSLVLVESLTQAKDSSASEGEVAAAPHRSRKPAIPLGSGFDSYAFHFTSGWPNLVEAPASEAGGSQFDSGAGYFLECVLAVARDSAATRGTTRSSRFDSSPLRCVDWNCVLS